jgi:hypothetical protein
MAAFAVREARAATRATGQGRKARDKEQYRVESPLCMHVGSVCPALSTTVCVGVGCRYVRVGFCFPYIRKEGGEGPCVHSYVFPPDYPKVKAPSDCLGSYPVHRHII